MSLEALNPFLSSSIGKTCKSPISVLQIRLQCQGEMLKNGIITSNYKGPLECVSRIIKEEGFLAFWKGNFTQILKYFPNLFFNLKFKKAFDKYKYKQNEVAYWKWFSGNLLSGALSSACSLALTYPLDFATTRLINDINIGNTNQFNGLIDVLSKTIETDGVQGLYRGFFVSIFGIMVYRACYFGFYDTFRHLIPKKSFVRQFLFGLAVTIASGLATYPLDTIRRRMMMNSGYNNGWECFTYILKNEGVRSFFKGAGVNIIGALVAAFTLVLYDLYSY